MSIADRIASLRSKMQENGVDFYVVPTADFHQSEYVGEYFKARKYITGFSGSAGTAVITMSEARLWTDGRYFIQAAEQIKGTGVELMKMGEPGVPTLEEYLEDALKEGDTIAFDGRVVSVGEGQEYANIAEAKGAKVNYEIDLIDEIWTDRPEMSKEPAFALGIEYTGETTESKLQRIRKVMADKGADVHAITTIDDLCWILNIRGNDIEFFPLVLSYGLITMDSMELYIDENKLSDEIKADLAKAGVKFHPYNAIYEDIKKLSEDSTVLIDPDRLNYALYNNIPAGCKKVEMMNPSIHMKAKKNETELANIRKAQIKDSIAHVKFMKWLKENIGKIKITEISASDKLDEFRKE